MTKDFLWRLKLHVGNWNEWPLVLLLVTRYLSSLLLKEFRVYYLAGTT